MGKTNLLDAIYYLSFCKSYSHIADSQIIRHDEDFFMLQGYYDNNGNEEEVYCGMKKRQKNSSKGIRKNTAGYPTTSDSFLWLWFRHPTQILFWEEVTNDDAF